MSDTSTRQRLLDCLRTVFPNENDDALMAASAGTHPDWDSIAQVTLITLIEEEFGVRVPEERYGELNGYAAMRAYLESPQA